MQQEETFRKIFNREAGERDAASFLSTVTDAHPYFGAAQFYLLKNSPGNPDISAKAALFFNDPFLLNAALQEKEIISVPETPIILQETVKAVEPYLESKETNLPPAPAEPLQPVEQVTPGTSSPAVAAPPAPEEMLFEPLHASDYFASQGIKLSEDMLGADKLGKQLKSFTAWLKTMKKAQPGKLGDVSIATETAMQTLAEKSNAEPEVLTEAMAEAFIVQEKQGKAIEVYHKLSLLNPSKSAYFAAKIESLK